MTLMRPIERQRVPAFFITKQDLKSLLVYGEVPLVGTKDIDDTRGALKQPEVPLHVLPVSLIIFPDPGEVTE